MNAKDNKKQAQSKEKPVEYKQVSLIVDGCKVKMNFPPAQENTVISDIKRMMLGGVSTK